MAKKKEIDENIEEVKKGIKNNKASVGTALTIKNLKQGNIAKIFLSSNVPDNIRDDITHYTTITETEVVELRYPNDELGALCKKPFPISVVGLLK